MHLHESGEMYLETIYILSKKKASRYARLTWLNIWAFQNPALAELWVS